jgi:hypothetical protein
VRPVWAARIRGDDEALKRAMVKQEEFLERTRQTPDQLAATTRKPSGAVRAGGAQKPE